MAGTDIQQLLDNPDSVGRVNLPSGEFEGKFIVRKSCIINGNNTVLWNSSGPVLVVDAENVAVNNLRIELTGDNIPDEQHISVYCKYPDTKFSGTEINGLLIGIPDEEQYWGIPKIISLGTLPAERETSFSLEIYAPSAAEISCGFHDVSLSADTLSEGFNTVTVTVGKIKSGSLLYGYIRINSAVERKIILSAVIGTEDTPLPENYLLHSVDREAPQKHKYMLENLDLVQLATMPEPEPEEIEITPEEPAETAEEEASSEENILITSGKRIPIAAKKYKIELVYESARETLDIDGYMFMLNENGVVGSDKHMIFFGNDHSDCGSVHYLNAPDKRVMYVDFRRIPADIDRMVVLFSIYGNNPSQLFDKLVDAEISILCENGVHMHLPLRNDINCRTLLAVGFERTEGIWEMISSGKGIGMPLAEICRSYGVTIVS